MSKCQHPFLFTFGLEVILLIAFVLLLLVAVIAVVVPSNAKTAAVLYFDLEDVADDIERIEETEEPQQKEVKITVGGEDIKPSKASSLDDLKSIAQENDPVKSAAKAAQDLFDSIAR